MKNCPLCGGQPDGALENCRDLNSAVPGSWTYRRCGDCRSLWMDPLPRPEEIPSFYPEKYYTHEAADSYGPTPGHALGRLLLAMQLAVLEARFGYTLPKDWWKRAKAFSWISSVQALLPRYPAARMVRFLPFHKGGRLLDIGCGNGKFLFLMRELGWEVEGIEPDPKAAAHAEKSGLPVRQGGIENVELEPNSYDAITLSHVAEHLLDPRAALERCVTALPPGGSLVSFSPNPEGWNAKHFRVYWAELDPPRHLVLPSFAGYRAILRSSPVKIELSTGPLYMGTFWRWSRRHVEARGTRWLEAAYACWLDCIGGPLRVAFRPEDGEECICIAQKNNASA